MTEISDLVDLGTPGFIPSDRELTVSLKGAIGNENVGEHIQYIGNHFRDYLNRCCDRVSGNGSGWNYILDTSKGLFTVVGGYRVQSLVYLDDGYDPRTNDSRPIAIIKACDENGLNLLRGYEKALRDSLTSL